MMDHSLAKSIFEEIQARPYRIATYFNDKPQNCYFKSIEFIQRIGALGYTVRCRIGESYWNKNIIPAEIVDLQPTDPCMTHIYPEVLIEEQWRIVDPTMPKELETLGFSIGSWEGTEQSCFPITKLFSLEESLAFWSYWFNPEPGKKYMSENAEAFKILDDWFAEIQGIKNA